MVQNFRNGTSLGQPRHVDGHTLCSRTIHKLDQLPEIPNTLLANASAEMAANFDETRKGISFDDPRIGKRLCFATCLAIAEQLYRFGSCPDILAKIVGGRFGEILATMMVASIGKQKRRRKTEGKHRHVKTRWNNVRNLWNDIPEIHETASAMLFSGLDKVQMLVPWEVAAKPVQGRKNGKDSVRFTSLVTESTDDDGNIVRNKVEIETQVNLRLFTCYDVFAKRFVECCSSMSNDELAMIREIADHNQTRDEIGEHNPNGWQFFIANAHNSETINGLVGREVVTIRRLKTSIRSGFSSCVIAAFGAAATRFIILEFGHSTEFNPNAAESRADRKSRKNHPFMLPLMLAEMKDRLTPIQRRIVDGIEFIGDSKELLEYLNHDTAKPIARTTFYYEWEKLKAIAETIEDEAVYKNER